MLKELLIKNFAIIDDLNIRFQGGLTILSGETGAGKSIIVNAVNPQTIRLLPPITVTDDEIDEAVAMVADALNTQLHEATA